MGKPEDTLGEISEITAKLVELGLSDDQKFPVLRQIGRDQKEITFGESEGFSRVLRNVSYTEAYAEIRKNRDYNLSLADGALVQLQYRFDGDEILKHRLAFFPSPDLSVYQNDPEIYEQDLIYAEVLERSVVTTPMRFDFDKNAFEEDIHPMSHFTIGQYKNCRIPVASAVSPFRFFEFVMNAFYNTAFRNMSADLRGGDIIFKPSITTSESKKIHVALELDL